MGVRRWLILAVGVTAQAMTCTFLYGLGFLVPVLQHTEGLDLTQAGLVVAAPVVGLLGTLIAAGTESA
ncbi:MFS transporter, partial [Kibdelosporangium lantanae]